MLWRAGQTRQGREQRERLAELFMTARDAALEVLVSTKQVKPRGAWSPPWYVEVAQPIRSPQSREIALARLEAMFPGIVQKGRPS